MSTSPATLFAAQLAGHVPENAIEAVMLRRTLDLLQVGDACFAADHYFPGHITGSAWILSPDRTRVLLTHHAKLDRWLQLGGHLEPGETPFEGAFREAREESGLETIRPVSTAIYDVDVHPIPARRDKPAHEHFDIRYVFEADPEAPLGVTDESRALAWVTLEQAARLNPEESIARLIRRTPAVPPSTSR